MKTVKKIRELQETMDTKDTRIQVERLLPSLAKEIMNEIMDKHEIDLKGAKVNSMPAELHMMVLAGAITSDLLSEYSPANDGDAANYICWVMESAIKMTAAELKSGRVRSGYVLDNAHNFYKKISAAFEKEKDYAKAAERLGIPENEPMIRKCIDICDERIL